MSTTTDPSLLHVSEDAWGEISPHAAFVHVALSADKLFSGRAAFENAEELRGLVVTLAAHDFPDDAVALEGASLDVSTGLFTRSSSVTYLVRIHVAKLDQLADVLDAIAECKRAKLTSISWDHAAGPTELLGECASRALAKAKVLATTLGVSIVAVQAVHEEALVEPGPPQSCASLALIGMPIARKARSSIAGELGGLDLAPKKKIGVRVRLACRIAATGSSS